MATNFFVCMYVYIHRFVHCSISIYYISPIFRSVHTTAFLYVVDFGKHINHYFWLVALRYKGIILLSCLTRSLIIHFLHSRYNIVFLQWNAFVNAIYVLIYKIIVSDKWEINFILQPVFNPFKLIFDFLTIFCSLKMVFSFNLLETALL